MISPIDFTQGKIAYRHHQGIGFKEPLARAIGIKPNHPLHILDATAGLGRDAFIMASLGCTVTLLERSKIVFEKLVDALKQAGEIPTLNSIIQRMQLTNQDSIEYLQSASGFDVIYLDPMYPLSAKSALVKKEMRDLREVVGDDLDVDLLFQAAMKTSIKRIVVKRHRHAPHLCDLKPTHVILTKLLRFDVYLKV